MENDKDNSLVNCILSLKGQYNSLSHSQAVRIIGFVAGLFTLIQTVQTSGNGQFSSLFPGLTILNIPLTPLEIFLFDAIKLKILFLSIFILVFYILRAFFKFSLFSAYSAHIRWIGQEEIENTLKIDKSLEGKNNIVLIEMATFYKISGMLPINDKEKYPREKIYKIFYYDWFTGPNNNIGYLVCAGLSFIITSVLFVILW